MSDAVLQNNHIRTDSHRPLVVAMTENAVFSAASGVVLAAGAAALDTWFGVPAWLLVLVGLGLVGYAADLVWFTRSPHRLALGGRVAVAADAAWVFGAAVLLLGFPETLTTQGNVALAVVTVVVAAFAVAQWRGLRIARGAA